MHLFFLSLFLVNCVIHSILQMPKTPLNQRTTRSNSNPNTAIQELTQTSKGTLVGASLDDVRKIIKDAKDEILAKLSSELAKMNACISALTSRVANIETGQVVMKSTCDRHENQISHIQSSIDHLKGDLFSSVSDEVDMRCDRMQNLIVSGLSELGDGTVDERKDHDWRQFTEVLDEMEIDKYDRDDFEVFRIGKPISGKPRLLKVICPDTNTKRDILRKGRLQRC